MYPVYSVYWGSVYMASLALALALGAAYMANPHSQPTCMVSLALALLVHWCIACTVPIACILHIVCVACSLVLVACIVACSLILFEVACSLLWPAAGDTRLV